MFDLRDLPDGFYDDPYPTYRSLREQSPVLRLPDGGYLVTGYEAAREVYRDPSAFSSDKRIQFAPVFGVDSPLYEHHTTSLVFNDPPLHTYVRKAIGNALSNKLVNALRHDLIRLVDELLDAIQEQGEVDLIADFAGAIPVEIIGNLLGVPRDERGPLRGWSLAILGSLEVDLDPSMQAHGERCVLEFIDYLDDLMGRRKRAPRADDILSRLMSWEARGRRLSTVELYHQCIFLLNAGHETTTNLIGNGIEVLLRHPGQLARLRREPRLIAPAVEEMLRFESPNQLGNRTTTREVRVGDCEVPADTVLTLCIGAANRDPAQFDAPDVFDIERSPNPHLAFGAGIHTCAGLNVARLEACTAIERFFTRFARVELSADPRRARRARFRGFDSLPAEVAP